ncbi:MAG TPA: hypothetical protein VNU68_07205 [Verrucomicrobiae bacterium]|nr:hypothetical protein [Verrucomicrobiae bacterium]
MTNSGTPRAKNQATSEPVILQLPSQLPGIPRSCALGESINSSQHVLIQNLVYLADAQRIVCAPRDQIARASRLSLRTLQLHLAQFLAMGLLEDLGLSREGHRRFFLPWLPEGFVPAPGVLVQLPTDPNSIRSEAAARQPIDSAVPVVVDLARELTVLTDTDSTGNTNTQRLEGSAHAGEQMSEGAQKLRPRAKSARVRVYTNKTLDRFNPEELNSILQVIADKTLRYENWEKAVENAADMITGILDNSHWRDLMMGLLWKIQKERWPTGPFIDRLIQEIERTRRDKWEEAGANYVINVRRDAAKAKARLAKVKIEHPKKPT